MPEEQGQIARKIDSYIDPDKRAFMTALVGVLNAARAQAKYSIAFYGMEGYNKLAAETNDALVAVLKLWSDREEAHKTALKAVASQTATEIEAANKTNTGDT